MASTSKICVGQKEFESVEKLIASGVNKGVAKECLGDYFCWWKYLVVRFPDKEIRSSAFVECTDTTVTVGYPAYWRTYEFDSPKQALKFAEKVNNQWLQYEGDWKDFLKEMQE